jgi:hypothetical protein
MKLILEADAPTMDAAKLDHLLETVIDTVEDNTGLQWTVKADGQIIRFASKASLLRSKLARGNGGTVLYDTCPEGYKVVVLDATGDIIEEYTGGNHESDSTTFVGPGSRGSVPEEKLLQYAKNTAQEMAAEFGIDAIEHDPDILAEEREMGGFSPNF